MAGLQTQEDIMKLPYILTIVFGLLLVSNVHAAPVTYSGVTFNAGDVSFADKVISYSQGLNVGPNFDDPSQALGAPDYVNPIGSVALGDGGSLVVQFTDNSLTTSGNSDKDLWIFEIGQVEAFDVYISKNNFDWISIGTVSGQPTGIDIDAIAGVVAGDLFSFVMLSDNSAASQTGFPFSEADIDAIGAISSGAAVNAVPIPAAAFMFAPAILGFMGLRRRAKSA